MDFSTNGSPIRVTTDANWLGAAVYVVAANSAAWSGVVTVTIVSNLQRDLHHTIAPWRAVAHAQNDGASTTRVTVRLGRGAGSLPAR